MSSYIELLNEISLEINIFLGLTFFILGFIGNIFNIILFSSLFNIKIFPPIPGRVYLLIVSIANFIFVGYLLLTRILISAFSIPLTNTYDVICKTRFYIGQVTMYTSLYTTCFATIDQYFSTNRSVRIRQLSKMSFAKSIVSISIFIWILINTPILKLYQLYPRANSASTVCTVYSSSWSFYYTYFQSLIFLCIIPMSLFILFSILTYRNIHSSQRINRIISNQMNQLVVLQSTTMFISLFVATIQIIYQNVTANLVKDQLRSAQDNLFNTLANLFTYVHYIGGFYIYFLSSKSFRKKLFDQIFKRNQSIQSNGTRSMWSHKIGQFQKTSGPPMNG